MHRRAPLRHALAIVVTSMAWLPAVAVAQPGQLDSSFGTNGKVTTSFSALDHAAAVALQADGKIVAVGRAAGSSDPATGDFAIARYHDNGTLDGSFGSAGKVTTDFAGFDDAANAVAIQADGKIVVAGYATYVGFRNGTTPGPHLALARYETTGSLDSSFGTGGKATMDRAPLELFRTDTFQCQDLGVAVQGSADIAIQADGKILVGAKIFDLLQGGFMGLARFGSSGSIDTSFLPPSPFGPECRNEGVLLVGFIDPMAFGFVVQPDGRIILAGNMNSNQQVVLSRHLPSGAFDTTFGTGGIATHDPPSFAITEQGADIALQPDGKIVVAGAILRPNTGLTYRDAIEVKRYNANGTRDTSFGSNGTAEKFVIDSFTWASAVVVDDAANIVVAGGVGGSLSIARFTPQGVLDLTFGPGGSVSNVAGFGAAGGLVRQTDGRIVAAGIAGFAAGQTDFGLVRVLGGTLTCTFALSTTETSVGRANGSGTVTVTAPAGCIWDSLSHSPWIVVTVGSGFGTGVLTYVYGANVSESARSGTVTIAGQTFTLNQSPSAGPVIQSQPVSVVVSFGHIAQFTVIATGDPPPTYQWQVSGDGTTWANVPDAAPYFGATSETLSIVPTTEAFSGNQYRVIATNIVRAVTSNAALLTFRTQPVIALERVGLRFGAVTSGSTFVTQTAPQLVRLTQSGGGTVTWTATPTQSWLKVSPASGSGPATLAISVAAAAGLPASGAVGASITFAFSGASNSPGPIAVTLVLVPVGTSTPPTGVVDTPTNNRTGVTGAVPFTGWALDDIEVLRVMICRAAVPGEKAPIDPNCAGAAQVFVGFAVFIDGARPDVQAAFPNHPLNSRGGWGFMVLTNMLPDVPLGLPSGGNGTYQFFAYAQDREGQTTQLGTRTMTCTNATATLPWGAIDTPGQGAVVSGTAYVNFGWALTQTGKLIPTNGSTIRVLVDGLDVGTADYNHFRPDIAALFHGYANSSGAVGFKVLDTTTLTNGLHTIVWVVTDNMGAVEGIGSRFFTVSNGVSTLTAPASSVESAVGVSRRGRELGDGGARAAAIAAAPQDETPILARRAWDLERPWQSFGVGRTGRIVIRGEELERIELALDERAGEHYTGYVRVGEELAPLPAGSQLNATTGAFTWAPGVGFVGTYDLVFVRWAGDRVVARREVRVILAPKALIEQ